MVEHQLPKLNTRVRFPPSAPSSLNTSFKISILLDIVCHAKIRRGPPQLSVLVIKAFCTGCECWTSVFVNVFRNLLLARACNFNAGALSPRGSANKRVQGHATCASECSESLRKVKPSKPNHLSKGGGIATATHNSLRARMIRDHQSDRWRNV